MQQGFLYGYGYNVVKDRVKVNGTCEQFALDLKGISRATITSLHSKPTHHGKGKQRSPKGSEEAEESKEVVKKKHLANREVFFCGMDKKTDENMLAL